MSFDGVLEEAGRLFGVHPRDIRGKCQYHFIMPARFAFYKAMRLRGNSYPSVGRFMHRDHSTVIYGERMAEQRMAVDPEYRKKIEALAAWTPTPIQELMPDLPRAMWVLEPEHA